MAASNGVNGSIIAPLIQRAIKPLGAPVRLWRHA